MAAKRIIITGLLLCLCLHLMPLGAQAVSTSDAQEPLIPDKTCSLTLSYLCGDIAIADLSVKLYQIAEVSATAQYTLTSPFQSSGQDLNGIRTVGEWDVIRFTMESHILANGITADLTSTTDHRGSILFDALKPGLYLVSSADGVQDELHCSFASALVALPGLDADGQWQYQVAASPKPQILPPPTPDDVQLQVLKLWKGDDPHRPESIDVELFRDGKSWEIVTLSEENHWSYSWTALNDGAEWMVAERNIPAGYTVSLEKRTTTFILTNTPESENPPPPPQTGDTPHILFYSVLMYLSGAALILLGLAGKRKHT